MKVTTILVSHNGARWLPAVLAGIQSQHRAADQVLVVDTGSTDDTLARLESTPYQVLSVDAATTYPMAVALALESLPAAAPDEWIWLLHDDSAPEAGALAQLTMAAAEAGPEHAAIGPKIREWPSLRRLLEVGVTITGTGQRETHLLPGEYDQGQHDNIHHSLAANTAGLLIRRSALESHPLDVQLPVFYTEIDLGWRLARAGLATVIEPRAVVFHAEAARRGLRDTRALRHPRALAREAAVYTMLVNSPAWSVPLKALRLLVGGLLRALGLLLVRAVDDAIDEVVGVTRGLSRINRILSGRAQRRSEEHGHRVRGLLAPWWLPYAHGGDFLSDIWVGISDSIAGVFAADEQQQPFWKRVLASPSTWGLLVSFGLALAINWRWLGASNLHGGALLAAPTDFGHWWSLWGQGWHWLGNGTTTPAAPYVVLLALGSLVTLGHPGWVVWLLFVLAVPLCMIGGLVFAHRLLESPWARVFLAGSYALLPVVSGAVAQGRIGTVAALILLPWPALSALRLASPKSQVRVRAAWRTATGAALVVMFVPSAWFLVALLLAASPWLTGHRLRRQVWLPILVLPVLFCLPWLAQTSTIAGLWLFESGSIIDAGADYGLLDVLAGRSGLDQAAPAWWGLSLLALALLAWLRPDTRQQVARSWLVIAAAALTVLLSLVLVTLPGIPVTVHPWLGFSMAVVQAGCLLAIAQASAGIWARLGDGVLVRRVLTLTGAALVTLVPLTGVLWWGINDPTGVLGTSSNRSLPTYMQDLARAGNHNATLVLSGGDQGTPVRMQLLRRGTLVMGDEGVLAGTSTDRPLAQTVANMLIAPGPELASELQARGVTYIYAPRPVSDLVSGAIDAAPGLVSASEPRAGTRAWQVAEADPDPLTSQPNPWHPILLLVQVFAFLLALVQVLPNDLRRTGVN